MSPKASNSRALKVVYRALSDLVPAERNARTHSAEKVRQIAASIREFGWTNPILLDESLGIIAGHGRAEAARSLEMAEVPTIVLRGLSEAQKRALAIADNQLALNAGWDEELLRLELSGLKDDGFNLDVLGFSTDALKDLLADHRTGLADPDEAPAVEEAVVSRLGDVWILGRHRLACGDSTNAEVVARALGGVKPHLMVTDPPYGVNYDPSWRVKAGAGSAGAAQGKVLNDDQADWREAWALFPGHVAYVWHGGLHAQTVADSLVASGFKLRAQIVWVKTRPALSRGAYHWQHEPAFYVVADGAQDDAWRFEEEHEVAGYAVRSGDKAHWRGGRKQSTVWFIEHLKSDTGHGTQKPVECMRRPIENNSVGGDAVYEPFSGSGTTLIACEMTGRSARAIELSPQYVDLAVRRWQQFTGDAGRLEGDGRTFEEIQAAGR